MGPTIHLAARLLLRNRLALAMLLAAVACGVGFQIPNLANLDGYSRELFEQGAVKVTGHAAIAAADDEPLARPAELAARLRGLPFAAAVTARLGHGGVLFAGNRYQAVRVVGIDAAAEQAATGLCDRLKAGRCLGPGPADEVLIGAWVKRKLHVAPGDTVRLYLPYEDLGEVRQRKQALTVAGVLGANGGFSAVEGAIFLDRARLAALIDLRPDAATSLHLFAADAADLEARMPAIRAAARPAKASAWWELNEFVASSIRANAVVGRLSLLMVLLAVVIPVLAVFTITVLHERHEIAALAAIGFGRGALFAVYFARTVIASAIGTALGVGIGLAVCAAFDRWPIFAHSGFVVRPVIAPATVLAPVAAVLAVSLLAGLWPAVHAARTDPARILREG